MSTSRENRISQIFDEVGRGSSLPHALGLIADQLAADIGAPTCKIWVVKRGDICDHCPLADSCSNRQMCMHLIAASGAVVDREYPRIPLSLFTAPLITRGGTATFSDSETVGDTLFGAVELRAGLFIGAGYYSSMGLAVPGAIGAQLALPAYRPIVLVGDGAFQMTGTELSTATRLGLKPIVLILNNEGYGTMRKIRASGSRLSGSKMSYNGRRFIVPL